MTEAVLTATPSTDQPATGIDSKARIATALTGVLADSYLLLVKTQGYHWNVVGPLFQPIHELTEKHYRDLFEAIDVIAERIRALGHLAPVSFTDLIVHANVAEETAPQSAASMVGQLIVDHESIVRRLREAASLAASEGDGATEDLCNSRMAVHEQAIWMLRAIIAD